MKSEYAWVVVFFVSLENVEIFLGHLCCAECCLVLSEMKLMSWPTCFIPSNITDFSGTEVI